MHKTLEIKQDFSDWIKRQIKSLGLEINVDYVKLHQKRELSKTGQTVIDYIITLDTAKHISMASRTSKGKEVRDYFIAIEKEYQFKQVPQYEILTQIAPVLQNLAEMMKLILENQDKQQIAPASLSLTPQQLGKIRGAVTLAAEVVAEFFEDELANAQKVIYSKLNNRLGVASYIYIPATAFSESMEILNDLERKYLQKLEVRRTMQVEINSDDLPKF